MALGYIAIIAYASLQPFTGWRMPPEDALHFLTAPWPRYVTKADLWLNVAAYLPLGVLLFAALRSLFSRIPALLVSVLIGGGISLALEAIQMFLPTRIASNLDVLTNTAGAALGATAALLVSLPGFSAHPLARIRDRTVRPGATGDLGLVVVVLWIVIQFHQAPLTLATGDVRDLLQMVPLFPHTPGFYFLVEACVSAFSILVLGAVVSLLMRPGYNALGATLSVLLLAFAAKSVSEAVLARSVNWLQWLTPGLLLGIGVGALLLFVVLQFPAVARITVGVLALGAAVFIINVSPENPYLQSPSFMRAPQPSHLISFDHIMRTLSRTWPLAAALFLMIAGWVECKHGNELRF